MNKNISNGDTEKYSTISIKRIFDIPTDLLWKAWSEPARMRKWWGPEGYISRDCIIDFRVGGRFLASMQGADEKKIWSTGVYQEIIFQKKIVNTDSFSDSFGNIVPASYYKMKGDWQQELLITVEFEEMDSKTLLTLQHEGLPDEAADDCEKGWQSTLDKLERLFKIEPKP